MDIWGTAQTQTKNNLLGYLTRYPSVNLNDLAYTYQVGRKHFDYRYALTCKTIQEAQTKLAATNVSSLYSENKPIKGAEIYFVFSNTANV